ncbi:MAG: hypothetical protein MSIBF_01205 [Candidatus Altiarchaeales archaeon IMC4]|nr:MAG: hypothetical protein MSIBF_01205 [Candidatus Altiarchaeales archaeon IMC4]
MNPEETDLLCRNLKYGTVEERQSAAKLLENAEPFVISDLIKALDDADYGVIKNAMESLSIIGDFRAVDALSKVAKESDSALIRKLAAKVVQEIEKRDVGVKEPKETEKKHTTGKTDAAKKTEGIFPFDEVRAGQREFMEDVGKIVESGGHLVAHVPTGIGKTAAAIVPALGFSMNNEKTVFFLTSKMSQHKIAIETIKKINKRHNAGIFAVDLIGRQAMCPHDVGDLYSWEFMLLCKARREEGSCKYFKNKHYGQMVEMIKRQTLHAEEIKKECMQSCICPYDTTLEAAKQADIVIADYYHLFSQDIRKNVLHKTGKEIEDLIIIVDEAHNLPDRVRNLLDYTITDYIIKQAVSELQAPAYAPVRSDIRAISLAMKSLAKDMKAGEERRITKEELKREMDKNLSVDYDKFVKVLKKTGKKLLEEKDRHRSYAADLGEILRAWDGPDTGTVRILQNMGAPSISYKILDPSLIAREVFDGAHASVMMSGTLTPMQMYADLMGITGAKLAEYQSPFPPENRMLIIVPGVTTKFTSRGDEMFRKIAKSIGDISENVPGNIAVFFPSYYLMNEVLNGIGVEKQALVEERGMTKEMKTGLLNSLADAKEKGGAVLFGVLGGSMSEGTDYADNLLECVIVVGIPLAKPTLEVDCLIEYYDKKLGRGRDYGYVFPAMNNVLQAMGRCIRSETDRGVIVLMDERFKWQNYMRCFPKDYKFILSEKPEEHVKRFFGQGNYKPPTQ